jgi:hypothetical protein
MFEKYKFHNFLLLLNNLRVIEFRCDVLLADVLAGELQLDCGVLELEYNEVKSPSS